MSNYSANEYSGDSNTPWHKIVELVPKGARVLDVGCSSGNLGATLMKEKNCEVIGIDLNERDVSAAKKILQDAYIKNIETDDLSSLGKFDCVIFADVIEHLLDPVTALDKVSRLLSKNGHVIFSIPNMAHMGTRLMLLEGRFAYGETGLLDKTHLHYYDHQEVERIFNDAGYVIEKFDWVERYIPDKILTERLRSIGLEPTEQFYNKNKEVDATAYEFVGKSIPLKSSQKHSSKLPFTSPYVGDIEEQIQDIKAVYSKEIENERVVLEHEIDELLHEKARFISSISWRITVPLRLANGVFWTVRQKVRIVIHGLRKNPKMHLFQRSELNAMITEYQQIDADMKRIKRIKSTKAAIIIHLYYIEAWDTINQRLKTLKNNLDFDVFVTLKKEDSSFTATIRKVHPKANIFLVPNRGRDVLPFMEVGRHLEGLGYEYILKLHSKKSPHRKDGQTWFTDMLDSLLPDSAFAVSSLKTALEKHDTGIVGPHGQYISLLVNYDSNSFFLFRTLRKVFSKSKAKEVHNNRSHYGFFAGTMFWARLNALSVVFDQHFSIANFEHEDKQIDGTIAHALERVFCVASEIQQRELFEIDEHGVKPIGYSTNNIPEWFNEKYIPKN